MADDDTQERPGLQGVTEWPGGFSWIANPDERAQRASHALVTEDGVWVVEPVDAAGLDERLAGLGEVVGVLVIHDRHTRDAAEVAHRHEVPVYVPEWMNLTLEKLDTTAELIGSKLPGTNYTVHRLIETGDWEEAVLVNQTTDTMLVPEALGTTPSFRADDDALVVHPALDDPPRRLTDWNPKRILVGHGESIHGEAARKIREAIGAE